MTRSSSRRRRSAGAAVVATGIALLLGLAACSTGDTEPKVASAVADDGPNSGVGGSTRTPSPAATPNVLAQYVDAQRAWVRCVRKQGYDLPDPDAKGEVDLRGFLDGAKLQKTDAGFNAALARCTSVQPTFPPELEPTLPPLSAEQLENARKYSRCMRANGMPDWPDPGPDGQYPEDAFSKGSFGREQTKQEQDANMRALQICDPVMGGKPPTTPDPNHVPQG